MPGSQDRSSRHLLPALILGLLALSLAACGSTRNIATQRVIAPENLELAKRKTLAMVEFNGDLGPRLSRRLAKRLAQVRVEGERLFDLTGPVTLHAGSDHDVEVAGSGEAVALARKLGARAVIGGHAALRRETDYEVPEVQEDCVKYADKKKKKCSKTEPVIHHCAELSVALKYSVLAVETDSGRPIYDPGVRRLVERERECIRYPAEEAYYGVELLEEKVDDVAAGLRRELLDQAVARIHRDIAPYREAVTITFLSEPDALPEAPAERFGVAAELVNNRRFEAGCEIWRNMVEAGLRDTALTYNLAACAEQEESYGVARRLYALTQRYADELQGRAASEERNYGYEDWAKLVAKAQDRVGWLYRSQQAMDVLRTEPLP